MDRLKFKVKAKNFLAEKGFYVVLFLCIAVIGVSAWILAASPGTGGQDGAMEAQTVQENSGAFSSYDTEETKNVTVSDAAGAEDTALAAGDSGDAAEAGSQSGSDAEEASSDTETEGEAAAASGALTYVWPLSGDIVTEYSVDQLIYSQTMADWRTHSGVDISAQLGTKVLAAADGTVSKVYDDDLFGTTVVIDHGAGICSVYSNLAGTPTVSEGDVVSMGDVIGSVGDTAIAEADEVPHLHFALTADGAPADPADFMPAK